jgi:thiamine-monophosphate kinase
VLSELGEQGLLEELARRGLVEGIGDDTAVLADGVVVTQDALVEDVHFRREWTSWRDLGYKAAAVNLSDLAAACAVPEALVVSLGLDPGMAVDAVVELYEGLNETGVPVRGGDVTRAERLYLSVTAIGRSDRVPGRGGARPGDVIAVTGPLGAAAAGLRALELGLEGHEELVRAHRRPPFRTDLAGVLGPVAHAAVDLSDGIATDAGHVAERSGCRIEIEVGRLPLAPGIEAVGPEPFWTLGEDYELLVALAPADVAGLTVVGCCVEGSGVVLLDRGAPLELHGFDHFRGG